MAKRKAVASQSPSKKSRKNGNGSKGKSKADDLAAKMEELKRQMMELQAEQAVIHGGDDVTSEDTPDDNESDRKSDASSIDVAEESSDEESEAKADTNVPKTAPNGINEIWWKHYKTLKERKDFFGTVNIQPGTSIYTWLHSQKVEYNHLQAGRKSKLNFAQANLLRGLGVELEVKKIRQTPRLGWEARFEMLQEYKEEHGDCNVPAKWKKNPILGEWVTVQRKYYKRFQRGEGKGTGMTQDRVDALNAIGFCWSLRK